MDNSISALSFPFLIHIALLSAYVAVWKIDHFRAPVKEQIHQWDLSSLLCICDSLAIAALTKSKTVLNCKIQHTLCGYSKQRLQLPR